jgi:hypothetical protein
VIAFHALFAVDVLLYFVEGRVGLLCLEGVEEEVVIVDDGGELSEVGDDGVEHIKVGLVMLFDDGLQVDLVGDVEDGQFLEDAVQVADRCVFIRFVADE